MHVPSGEVGGKKCVNVGGREPRPVTLGSVFQVIRPSSLAQGLSGAHEGACSRAAPSGVLGRGLERPSCVNAIEPPMSAPYVLLEGRLPSGTLAGAPHCCYLAR